MAGNLKNHSHTHFGTGTRIQEKQWRGQKWKGLVYWGESGARVEAAGELATPGGGREGQHLGEEVCRGLKGRKLHVLRGRVSMLRSGGRGCQKGSSGPGDHCRGGME